LFPIRTHSQCRHHGNKMQEQDYVGHEWVGHFPAQ
jgi:hypothetical protein